MNVAMRRRQRKKSHAYLLFIVVASLAAVFLVMSHGFSKTLTPPAEEYTEVVVRDGDTLWQIARRHGSSDVDTRRTVDRIREMNELTTAVVRPGQVLKVPVQ